MQFGLVPKQMFPLSERNQFLIYMNMPDGTDISETEARALEISKWLADPKENPEIASHILYVGDGGPRFYLTLTPVPADPAVAFFLVNTKDYQGAVRAADRAWRYLYENHPEARFKIKRLAMGSVEAGIVDVEISGPDADRLLALGEQVRSLFQAAPGIRDNDDDWGNKIRQSRRGYQPGSGPAVGLTSEEITQTDQYLFHRDCSLDLSRGRQTIPIVLRAGAETHQSLEGLTSATFANNGNLIPLRKSPRCGPVSIFRAYAGKTRRRTIIVTGRSATLTAAICCESIQPGLQELDLSGGYHIDIGGEIEKSAETNQNLVPECRSACCHGDRDHTAIQFVSPHLADLPDYSVDLRRNSLWLCWRRATAVVFWDARDH